MIAIASIKESMSGDYMFLEKLHPDEVLKPWQLAKIFYDRMQAVPENIFIIENDEITERWYAGNDYPDENPY